MQSPIKVLLVDDDTESRSLYADSLRAVNFEVIEGNDGLEGLELATKHLPNVIVSGIIMPRMDGFQFTEALRKNVATNQIPIFFLSHLGREEDQKRAGELGVKNFLLRDMTTPNDMIEAINALFFSHTYVLGIDSFSFDAEKFAKDFNLDTDFLCSKEKPGGRITLTLKKSKGEDRHFDAEITCS